MASFSNAMKGKHVGLLFLFSHASYALEGPTVEIITGIVSIVLCYWRFNFVESYPFSVPKICKGKIPINYNSKVSFTPM